MKMMYDIIIIGAGSGGLNIAGFMNKAGFKVLLIDKSDKDIGGDCLNFGCVPSKALIHVSRLAKYAKDSEKFGIRTSGNIDLKKVMDYVKKKQDIIREHENATYFRKIGMDVALGSASFAGKNKVKVAGTTYTGKKIVIATGSRPRTIDIPGIRNVNCLTNETIFDLKVLPKKMVVIGGGPIGIELGQAFCRLGSEVSVIQNGPMFLPKEDPDIAKVLLKQLKNEGMKFFFNSNPKEFVSKDEVMIETKVGKTTLLKFDKVLVSIGRVLDFDGLNLEKAGIEVQNGRIIVDDYLRTTNKDVFVCGDAVGNYQFTHAAELHAGVIINNLFSPKKKKVSYDNLSWVTYTSPEIATFGLSEKILKERKIKYKKLELDFKDDDRSIVDDYTDGKLVIYIGKKKILGGSMVAMNAGELFQELVLANSSKLDIKNIFYKVYPYPTATRINKAIISKYFASKLTPRAKKILKWMY